MTMPRDWPYKGKSIDNDSSRIVSEDLSNETQDKDRDQLIFDLIKRRYDSELETNNSFDNKASSLVGFVSILIGLLFVSGTFELSVITSNLILSTSYFLGTGLLVGSIIFSLLAFRIRRFIIVPDVNQLLNEYSDRPYLEVLKRTGATMQVAVEDIEKKNADKAKWIRISWYSLMVGIVILFVFLGLYATIGMEIKNAQ